MCQQLQWLVKDCQEVLLLSPFLGHLCDSPQYHVLPLHPHASPPQGQLQKFTKNQTDGNGGCKNQGKSDVQETVVKEDVKTRLGL